MKSNQVISWSNQGQIYHVRVSALGYEDVVVPIQAKSKALALGTNNRLQAIIEWEKHNDIEDSAELPSVSILEADQQV